MLHGTFSVLSCLVVKFYVMKKIQFSIGLLAIALISLFAFRNPRHDSEAQKLNDGMRKLWEDHITWTRNVICCLVDGLPGSDQALKRLLENQDDIGNAIKPYYGDEA